MCEFLNMQIEKDEEGFCILKLVCTAILTDGLV